MAVAIQRPLKGSRISSFYPVKSLPPLSALDSAFQLQEYISLLIRLDVHDVEKIVSIPGKGSAEGQEGEVKTEEKEAEKEGTGSVNVDEACWVYEQLRRLAQDLSHPLITMLQQECTRSTCPEMKAGEWLYLCVAHGNEGAMEQCCAIDYILHTLDSATALLNSPRAFPSRLSVPPTSHRHFSSLARRLGRIFAHAYFHHREAFEQAEAESSLYARFLALTSKFDLVPAEFLVIPPRLTAMSDDDRRSDLVEPPRLLGAALDPLRDSHRSYLDTLARREASRRTSPPGPAGAARNESPRKFGRNRTDTMVYSEAFSVAEELAKGDPSEADFERELAAAHADAVPDADRSATHSVEEPAQGSPPFTDEPEEAAEPTRETSSPEAPEPESAEEPEQVVVHPPQEDQEEHTAHEPPQTATTSTEEEAVVPPQNPPEAAHEQAEPAPVSDSGKVEEEEDEEEEEEEEEDEEEEEEEEDDDDDDDEEGEGEGAEAEAAHEAVAASDAVAEESAPTVEVITTPDESTSAPAPPTEPIEEPSSEAVPSDIAVAVISATDSAAETVAAAGEKVEDEDEDEDEDEVEAEAEEKEAAPSTEHSESTPDS